VEWSRDDSRRRSRNTDISIPRRSAVRLADDVLLTDELSSSEQSKARPIFCAKGHGGAATSVRAGAD
jgi:hypothetical protein